MGSIDNNDRSDRADRPDRLDASDGAPRGGGDGWLLAYGPRRGARLLLVTRDSPARRLLRDALAQRGHEVCLATDAHEAAALCRRQRFEVALVVLPAQGVPALLQRLRAQDADLEVVWAPPPLGVGQADTLVREGAERARRRLGGLLGAARALLQPLPPERTAARLLEQAEEVLGGAAHLRSPEPTEPLQALLRADRRRLRLPLWEGPLPEDEGGEDGGHRLDLERPADGPELSEADLLRAQVLRVLGALSLTRAHCEQALVELYRELEHSQKAQRGKPQAPEAASRVLTSGAFGPLERLAGVLAHELNNPLTFVLANLSCLEEDLDGLRRELEALPGAGEALRRCAELREVLGEALGGAGRVREVVADLTTLGAREGEGATQPVVVEEVVRAALRIARREVQRRAQVVVEIEPRLPRVIGSKSRLGQVLLNLLLNAVQAVPGGDAAAHEVRIRARAEGEQVLISISDTGEGIPPERLARVFEPGYTTKPSGEGSGLGLAISREIVRTHGGDIRIESKPGVGTTVTVVLPALGRPPRSEEKAGDAS